MSDYVHKKAVRLPFPPEIMTKCNADDPYDCEGYLKELLGDLWDNKQPSFHLDVSDVQYYIDWVYYYTYGDESGDFGTVRMLTDNEFKVIEPLFDKLMVKYTYDDLRVVDFCYYNCCEAPDYYDIKVIDQAHLFLK